MRVTKGLDVSSYNPVLDYVKIASQIDFVILRAGFTGWGTGVSLNIDKSFEKHYENFKKAGVPMGVYYYSCADTVEDAVREAKFLLDIIKGKQFEYPIYIDVEDPYHQKKKSKAELSQAVLSFCRTIEDAGYYAGVYANSYWWRNELDQEALKSVDKWVAHYGVPTPAVQGEMWQYTENGELNGHKGALDLNYCYKDYPAIIKKAGLNGFGGPITPTIIVKGVKGGEDDKHVELAKQLLSLLGFTVTVEET